MKVIECGREYSVEILEILNDAIINSTALYDYKPRTLKSMVEWFDSKEKNKFPVIGIVDDNNKLLAFGSYGTFRAWPAYHYSIEHSVYVEKNNRGKGYGGIILKKLIDKAISQEYHCIVAGIDSENIVSIELHKKHGFKKCGEIKQVGYKFNKWLNLSLYQLILKTPEIPGEL